MPGAESVVLVRVPRVYGLTPAILFSVPASTAGHISLHPACSYIGGRTVIEWVEPFLLGSSLIVDGPDRSLASNVAVAETLARYCLDALEHELRKSD